MINPLRLIYRPQTLRCTNEIRTPGPGSDVSILQLLDTVEKELASSPGPSGIVSNLPSVGYNRLTNSPLAGGPTPQHPNRFGRHYDHRNRWVTDLGFVQIDDTTVLRKLKSIKNSLAPINRTPPETLSHTATFLVKERDLTDATAVCRHWRTILLSFPRLWSNASGSLSELEAYLERSESVPIEVNLSSPHLVPFIVPHTFRLVALTICANDSSCVNQIAENLHRPIPTLRSIEIRKRHHLCTLELPSGLCEGLISPNYSYAQVVRSRDQPSPS